MIGAKHFILPLLEKRNLITIFLIMLFFGIFRWSGGSLSSSPEKPHRSSPRFVDETVPEEFAESLNPRAEINRRQASKKVQQQDLELEEVINSKPAAAKVEPERKASSGSSRLSDIEKSLGLR